MKIVRSLPQRVRTDVSFSKKRCFEQFRSHVKSIIKLLSVTRWTTGVIYEPFHFKRKGAAKMSPMLRKPPDSAHLGQSKQDSSLRVSKGTTNTHIKRLCKTQRTDSDWIRSILQTHHRMKKTEITWDIWIHHPISPSIEISMCDRHQPTTQGRHQREIATRTCMRTWCWQRLGPQQFWMPKCMFANFIRLINGI